MTARREYLKSVNGGIVTPNMEIQSLAKIPHIQHMYNTHILYY